jgi:hypothetical protein
MTSYMKFTQLLPHIQATYPEQPRKFHVLATRYYIGAETTETLRMMSTTGEWRRRVLTEKQVDEIIRNR